MMEDIQPRLLFTELDGTRTYPVVRSPFTIGRSSDCDLCIPNAQVSRQHAIIELAADGVYLRDLGSRHGTWRNGQRVDRARLYSGDRITLGNANIGVTYVDDGAPDPERMSHTNSESGVRDTARELLTRVSSQG